MSAVLPAFVAHAGIDAEQVCVSAVNAFAQRDADFGHGDFAGAADGEEVPAGNVIFALGQIVVVLDETENPASHINVRMLAMIGLDLFQAFICPVDAIFAVDHGP
jgi:hypothetical protein